MTEWGSCGSTKALQALLEPAGVGTLSLRECQGERTALRRRLELARSGALAEVLATIEQRRHEHQERAEMAVLSLADREARALQQLEQARRAEAERKRKPGLWRFLLLPKSQIAQHSAKRKVVKAKASALTAFRELAAHKTQTASMAADPQSHANRLTLKLQEQLAVLEFGLESPEFRGAIGEEMVAESLRTLPSPFVVAHDLVVRLGRPTSFMGARRFEAQVDHAVLSSRGLDLIETKNWSQAYAQSSERCPFRQAASAAHIVRCSLRDAGLEIPVRAWLVNCGALPQSSGDYWVKVRSPQQIAGSIQAQRASATLVDIESTGRWLASQLKR